MQYPPLKGHSGCSLTIVEYNGELFVKKTSKNKAYNKRLIQQCEKQNTYSSSTFKTPRILKKAVDSDGLFNFTMEYVSGEKLSDYLKIIPLSRITDISNIIVSLIPTKQKYNSNSKKIFQEKIESLKKNIKNTRLLEVAFKKLREYPWEKCPQSSCHGDLTLENILLSRKSIYVIDFLDSFYDSWMIDIAKIFQDLECFWSYRNDTIDENLEIRLLILKEKIIGHILSKKNGHETIKTIYHILLMNLLRIIPYTEDSTTLHYLEMEIKKIIDKIDTL